MDIGIDFCENQHYTTFKSYLALATRTTSLREVIDSTHTRTGIEQKL